MNNVTGARWDAERALWEGLHLGGEDGAKLVLPVTAMRLGLVEDLETEYVVFEIITKSCWQVTLTSAAGVRCGSVENGSRWRRCLAV